MIIAPADAPRSACCGRTTPATTPSTIPTSTHLPICSGLRARSATNITSMSLPTTVAPQPGQMRDVGPDERVALGAVETDSWRTMAGNWECRMASAPVRGRRLAHARAVADDSSDQRGGRPDCGRECVRNARVVATRCRRELDAAAIRGGRDRDDAFRDEHVDHAAAATATDFGALARHRAGGRCGVG